MVDTDQLSDRYIGQDISAVAHDWSVEGRDVAIATVIETWGSAPWPAGTQMVIDREGHFQGSVSGGCVEGEVLAEAADVIVNGRASILEFGVADETAWRVGLACGGRIRIRVEKPAYDLAAVAALLKARTPFILTTDLVSGETAIIRQEEGVADIPDDILAKAFLSGKASLVELPERTLFLNPSLPSPEIVVIGAVQITQALAPIAAIAGYDLRIIDPRQSFATQQRFGGLALQNEWPQDALVAKPLDARTALVALSHDPKIDDYPLVEALNAGCLYVGALGSRKTHAKRLERLAAMGVDEAGLARIASPVGLDIGASSPAEIAVAIMAEIIAAFRLGVVPTRKAVKP